MTTNQAIDGVLVPRELLELAYLEMVDTISWAGELRALLDAPSDWCSACQGRGSVSADHMNMKPCPSCKPAAKYQGDPVAHCLLRRNGAGEWVNDAKSWADGVPCCEIVAEYEKHPELYRVRLAYADQPAPVAVVLPERKAVSVGVLSESNTHNQGWNACLDEVKRLNTK